jgi:hypothetical protein
VEILDGATVQRTLSTGAQSVIYTAAQQTADWGAPGWRAWVEDEGLLLVFDGSARTAPPPSALQNRPLLGVGATADTGNPFAAKLNAALWTAKTVAEGGTGDLFYALNKETAATISGSPCRLGS